MLTVIIYKAGRLHGTIDWDRASGFSLDPPGDDVLQQIILEPIRVNGPLGMDSLESSRSPERFMRALHRHYKSAYLMASRVEES